jgi:site-specific DNA-methyltransferase (adenine-specific)
MDNKIETKITFNDLINSNIIEEIETNNMDSNEVNLEAINLEAINLEAINLEVLTENAKSKLIITKKAKKAKQGTTKQILVNNLDEQPIKKAAEVDAEVDTAINIEIKNCDGLEYLKTLETNSIDLILTDPPYIISRDSGMNTHYNKVKKNEDDGVEYIKTETEWAKYKEDHPDILNDDKKENYMKYGTIYGKKYCVKTQYGSWDEEFTMDILEKFIKEYYNKLKKGGTLIIWFDLWKITDLKNMLEKYKFKQIRFIEWIKTNPQPLNSSTNYLTNCREIALVCVKDGKPVFNSKYDDGVYRYPLQGGKNRFHPTQKSLALFEDLIKKHSNENAVVLDTFLGGGTTAIACKNTKRNFKGCEISKEYYDKARAILFTSVE